MENVTGLPGAKHKQADEVDADVLQKRRELFHKVLAGTFSAAQTWGYLTASGSAEPIASTHMDKHDDGTAPVIDWWRKHSDKERWVWVSPRDAAPTLHQVGVSGAIVCIHAQAANLLLAPAKAIEASHLWNGHALAPFPESASVCAPATAATAVRLEMHVGKGKSTGAKHRLSYSPFCRAVVLVR
jgi:hypothetical protein